MTAGADDRVSALLAECLEQLSLGGEGVLDRVCAEHPEQADALRARMGKLEALGLVGGGPERSDGPQRMGPFTLAGLLGQGGMGRVYLAQQTEPVRRVAAVKLMHAGLDAEGLLRRFDAERQALAVLSHPGIAQVLEAGATDDGRPWFAMEFVDGLPITAWCAERDLDVEARIALFLQLCDAVTHAHQNGILHRDLKPSNVLVSERAGRPLVKVIDFGLAKALEQDAPLLTRAGQIVGTPSYMSPEQAGVTRQVVDSRSDQYALGVMLYELLTDELPLAPDPERPDTLLAMQELLRDVEPVPPSRRVAGRHAARARALTGDLDWIVGRALAKDRDRRYGSVSELAEDLRRHQRHEPVAAGPPSAAYRLSRLLRRHRREAVVAGVALLGLVAAFVYIVTLSGERGRQLQAFDLLALGDQVADLERRADAVLWPEVPALLPAFDAWIAETETLLAELSAHRDAVAHVERRGRLVDGEWFFDLPRDAVLHAETQAVLPRVEALGAEGGRLDAVRARRAWASELEQFTLTDAADLWRRAADEVAATPAYDGLALTPQLGLLPLGADPHSGLQEFAMPRRGERVPVRDGDGRLTMTGDASLVFVLVPGGSFAQGAQGHDPAAPGWLPSPAAAERDGGVVSLAPYLLSKFEMTQGQWRRATGDEPSRYAYGDEHPVEQVTWLDADTVLGRLGLRLPTGAQWERAARGDRPWPWWHGPDATPPGVCANLADAQALAKMGPDSGITFEPDYDDGFPVHAPVGRFPPGPFGLHDVIGNLWEWCKDPGLPYDATTPRPGDGLRIPNEEVDQDELGRELRGGSFFSNYAKSRSTFRFYQPRQSANNVAGVRPSRMLSGGLDPGAPP